jgi:hypothetical protein
VCTGWLKVQNLSTERRVEGLLSQGGVHRVKEIKYLEVFEEVPQGVRAGVFFFKTRSCERSSGELVLVSVQEGRN